MKKLNSMDKILLFIAIFLICYIVVDMAIFWVKGSEPSTLTMYVFIAITGECGFMGWIKTAKVKAQDREWQKADEKEAREYYEKEREEQK